MAKFATHTRNATTPAQTAVATTFKTFIEVASAATGRGQIYELNVGADGPPSLTDCAVIYDVNRLTATGTGVASTFNALNPADAASRSTCKINHTIEPTPTTNSSLLELILNQRASQRWIAAPGSELIWPNTSANGLGCRALSTNYTGAAGFTAFIDDL